MNETFNIAWLIDGVIAFTLLECTVLAVHRQRSGRGLPIREFLPNMVSGVCLMLALRCFVHGASDVLTALMLLAAGVAHATDIGMRLRRGVRSTRAGSEFERKVLA